MQSDLQDNAPGGAPSLAAVWRGAGRNYEQVPAVVTSVQHTWATGHHLPGHLASCSLVTCPGLAPRHSHQPRQHGLRSWGSHRGVAWS